MIADTVHMYQVMYTFMYECGARFTHIHIPGGATFMMCTHLQDENIKFNLHFYMCATHVNM